VTPQQGPPWQVKFAYAFGIPAVIAMYLVYYQTNQMDQNQLELNRNVTQLSENIRNLRDGITQDREHTYNMERKYDRLLNMMVRICATTAETNTDRNSCFEYVGTKGTAGLDKADAIPEGR
jgi:hypothetical protein